MINVYEAQSANKRKSAIILVLFVIFFAIAIYVFSSAFGLYYDYGPGGLGIFGIALIISGLTSFGSYYYSDKIVLKISGAKPADKQENFVFYSICENLSIASGIAMPKLYVINDSAPNAFATGRDPEHAVVCVTKGLLEKLNRTELENVVAHEYTHIKNYDIRLMSIVTVLVGVIALLGDWFLRASFRGRRKGSGKSGQIGAIIMIIGLLFALLSPLIAKLIQLAISRRREYFADAGAISITRQPAGLISALTKISKDIEPLEAANKATAHLYIVNPFKVKVKSAVGWFSGLFNTHPPIETRISALQKMA